MPPARPPLDSAAILRALDRHRVDYVLIGGLAAVVYGSAVPTTDIDVTPSPERANLGRLASALTELGAQPRVPGLDYPVDFPLDEFTFDRFTSATFRTPHGDLDVVLRPDAPRRQQFTYDELEARAATVEVFGVELRVADLSDVIASKSAAGREQDLAVLPHLRRLVAQREQLAAPEGPELDPPDAGLDRP